MNNINWLSNKTVGAGVLAVAALLIFGAAGAVTVASLTGVNAGLVAGFEDKDKDKDKDKEIDKDKDKDKEMDKDMDEGENEGEG